MRAACVVAHYDAELKMFFSDQEYNTFLQEWRRGARDADLFGHCRIMAKDFKFDDLRFVQLHKLPSAVQQSSHDEDSLTAAQKQAKISDFNLDYEQLKEEQKASLLRL